MTAYERLGFLALGFFVIHIGGRCYGVRAQDATMLACSFSKVERRIAERGLHTAPFAAEPELGKLPTPIGMRFTPLTRRRNGFSEPRAVSFVTSFTQMIWCGRLMGMRHLMTGAMCCNLM
jgi:hypothetical protein